MAKSDREKVIEVLEKYLREVARGDWDVDDPELTGQLAKEGLIDRLSEDLRGL